LGTLQLTCVFLDAILLTNFIAKSSIFKSQDQHWVPVCFPGFNAQGYLQVIISLVVEHFFLLLDRLTLVHCLSVIQRTESKECRCL
jgi:hypothetical protein